MVPRFWLLVALGVLLAGSPLPVAGSEGGVGYYPNGRVQWEYLYQQGEVREARWYDESGRLSARTVYAEGEATVSEGYHADGALAWQSRALPDGRQEVTRFAADRRLETRYQLQANQADGVSTVYYPNGQPRQTVTFRNGILHGPARSFFENGRLESAYAYRDGLLDGPLRNYAADGRLLSEQQYLAGVLRENP